MPRQPNESWEEYAVRRGVQPIPELIQMLQQEEENDNRARNSPPGLSTSTARPWTTGASFILNNPRGLRTPDWFVEDEATPIEELAISQDASSPEKTQPNARTMTPELEHKLFKCRETIERRQGTKGGETRLPPGRREGQFLQLVRKRKQQSMSAHELVNSEIPICADEMGRSRLYEITNLGLLEIKGDGKKTSVRFFCAACQLETPIHFAYFCNGHLYCSEHVPNLVICGSCQAHRQEEQCKAVTTYDDREILVCDRCLANRRRCGNCAKPISAKFVASGICMDCINNPREGGPMRRPSHSLKWTGQELGEIVKSKRFFSCEIEALTTHGDWAMQLFKSLPKEMGIGEDGSVKDDSHRSYGFEIQTPRLVGEKGEELMRRMSSSLKAIEATINPTCGMHVHLDGKGIIGPHRQEHPTALMQLWKTFIVFEDVFFSLVPYSRRQNDYCRPLTESFQLTELDMVENMADAEKLWYLERTYDQIRQAKGHKYHATKYFGANFHSLLANGHFEVRFHSGTTNPKKVLEWANLHALIMDACAKKVMTHDFFREAQATSRMSEKTYLLFERIGLAEPSRQYFRGRQKKFGDKKTEDEEVKISPPAKKLRIPEPPLRFITSDSFDL